MRDIVIRAGWVWNSYWFIDTMYTCFQIQSMIEEMGWAGGIAALAGHFILQAKILMVILGLVFIIAVELGGRK